MTHAPAISKPSNTARLSFYSWLALAAIALTVAAFAPSLVDPSQRRAPLTALATTHAVLMSAWLILFLAQSRLASTGRIRIHRRLGVASAFVAAAAVTTGFVATVAMVRRGFDLSGDLSRPPDSALDATIFQFLNLVVFGVLVGTAIAFRRRPQTHKRLMGFAVIQTLMAAPLGHLVGHFGLPVVTFAIWGVGVFVAFLVHDIRSRRRVHPVTVVLGIGLIVLANLAATVIGPSARWQRVLEWMSSRPPIELPGTR